MLFFGRSRRREKTALGVGRVNQCSLSAGSSSLCFCLSSSLCPSLSSSSLSSSCCCWFNVRRLRRSSGQCHRRCILQRNTHGRSCDVDVATRARCPHEHHKLPCWLHWLPVDSISVPRPAGSICAEVPVRGYVDVCLRSG